MKISCRELDRIAKIRSSQKRGKAFEKLLAKLFEDHEFQVHENPKSTKPRQSDLIVSDDKKTYLLIEAKHQASKIDVADIDEVRNRLRKLPSDFVGAIFSISDFGNSAKREVEADKTREILLFNREEIQRLIAFESNLQNLIHRKRESLRVSGTVWFFQPTRHVRHQLRDATKRFQINNICSAAMKLQTGYTRLLFNQMVWLGSSEQGVALRLQLNVENKKQLRDFLALIENRFGLSNEGSYVIEQSFASWHGIGAKSFVEEVGRRKQRYINPEKAHIHHSEDLAYFDSFKDGWIVFTARQNTRNNMHNTNSIYQSEILIQLPGLPVDMSPFLNLCRETNNLEARFCPVSHYEIRSIRFKKPIKITTLGTVVDFRKGNDSVCGFIAKNPFFGLEKFPPELDKIENPMALKETEVLICSSTDWHGLDDKIDYYVLTGIETMWAGSQFVVRPFGTWNNIVNRTPDSKDNLIKLPTKL